MTSPGGSAPRWRRRGALVVVIGCALGPLFAALPAMPAAACACGGGAPSPGAEVSVNEEFGIPLGWLLVALGGILVLAVLLVIGMVNTKHS